MKYSTLILTLIVIALTTINACSTIGEVINCKEDGTVKIYSVNEGQAWDIAVTVLRWEDCGTIEQHRDTKFMLTIAENVVLNNATYVGVWIEQMNNNETKVTVVTKRKNKISITSGLTESTFHNRFTQAIDIIKSGELLPLDPPPLFVK